MSQVKYPVRIEDREALVKFRELVDHVNNTNTRLAAIEASMAAAPPLTLSQIQTALQQGGSNPLNITGLLKVAP